MTTTTDQRQMTPARMGNPVARHLQRTQLRDIVWLWLMFVAATILVGAVLHSLVDVGDSIWSTASIAGYWFALGMGVYLTAVYLPVYVAHGRTRREVYRGSARFAVVFAAVLGMLLTAGYAIEAGLYRVAGVASQLPDPHPLGSPGLAMTTLAEQAVGILVYLAVGALGGAGFYRMWLIGMATIPVGLGLLFVYSWASETDKLGPLPDWAAGDPPAVALALLVGVVVTLVAAALTWAIVRDVPLRPRSS